MKVYLNGDLVTLEKNAEPTITINQLYCIFLIKNGNVYIYNKQNTSILAYDTIEEIKDVSNVAIGTLSQVNDYLKGFIRIGSVQTKANPIGETFDNIRINFKLDSTANSILFQNTVTSNILDVHNVNTIQAVANGTDIRIQLIGGHKILIDRLDLEGVFINSSLVTQVLATAIVELNALFSVAGLGVAPVITASTTISLTTGNSLNWEMTATNAVAYQFEYLPSGITTLASTGKPNVLIGGSSLAAGTYTFTGKALSYGGEDSKTFSLVVAASFTNTYSFETASGTTCVYNGSGTNNSVPMYRAADGTGSSDAWSVHFWYNIPSAGAWTQNYFFSFGYIYGSSGGNGGGCHINHWGSTFKFVYGDAFGNCFQLSFSRSHTLNTWHSMLICYTGNSTGTSTANAAAQFTIYIDSVAITPTVTQITGSNGYTGSIEKSLNAHSVDMCIGGICSTAGAIDACGTCYIDELACWSSELSSSDAVSLYNSGTPIDLSTAFTPLYSDWWRMGDNSDVSTFPVLNNMSSGNDLNVVGGSVASYVSLVP
tara:strand:+ start:6309 stop:7931 length:1623 start_codon:yes stop_codon:yes gene_type:complete